VKAGPSHTTTPTTNPQRIEQPVQQVTQKNQNNPQTRAGPIPQDPTARLDDPHPHIHVPHPQQWVVLASVQLLHI
jgi:hypothetical protein